jgi:ribosomal protein S18 acetylase RimI-like enzyme
MARRGLGTMMVRHAEQQARDAGYPRLIVRANINAVGLYTALGYVPFRKDVMLGANGVQLPVVMMEKQDR